MSNKLPAIGEDLDEFGPAMQALTSMQRQFVIAYCEHPNYSAGALAAEAGYSGGTPGSAQLRVVGHMLLHNEKVIAAMHEEAGKRMRSAGLIGVSAVVAIAANPEHADHLKAALALMDRTGFHAKSEHKVVVDDKRPQTKQELVDAVRNVARELGLDEAAQRKLIGDGAIDADFKVIEEVVTMEDL